jgi:hypothetical protein
MPGSVELCRRGGRKLCLQLQIVKLVSPTRPSAAPIADA